MHVNDFYGFISVEKRVIWERVEGIKGEADGLPLTYSRFKINNLLNTVGTKLFVSLAESAGNENQPLISYFKS